MSKHTPGPWDAVGLTVYDTCMDGVASCHSADDAHLIAAAPDLLEALRCLYALVQGECPSLLEDDHHDDMVRAAIAKAEGK